MDTPNSPPSQVHIDAEQLARRQTAALARTIEALTRNPTLDDFLGLVVMAISEQLKQPDCAIFFYDKQADTVTLQVSAHAGAITPPPLGGSLAIASSSFPYFKKLRETRQPVVFHDIQSMPDSPSRRWLIEHDMRSLLGVPLVLGEQVVGFMRIPRASADAFTADEIELAKALAQQAALAVQLTRLASEARHSAMLRVAQRAARESVSTAAAFSETLREQIAERRKAETERHAAVLEERARIARDIHDTLGQTLAAVVIQLTAARDALQHEPASTMAHVEAALTMAREGLGEARRSTWALRPRLLEEEDLPHAMEKLVTQQTAATGIRPTVLATGTVRPLPPETEVELLRICQEAVGNTFKHSAATELRVELCFEEARVRLEVQDNGRGFDPSVASLGRGFGLISMHERAQRIGGDLRITSQAEEGTRITVTIPYKDAQTP